MTINITEIIAQGTTIRVIPEDAPTLVALLVARGEVAVNVGPVIIRLRADRTYLLAAEHAASGHQIDELRRPYTDLRTALLAYRGMATLFGAGHSVAEVVEFARLMAVQPVDDHLTACEVAA